MRSFWLLSGIILSTFLCLFLFVELLNLPIETLAMSWVEGGGILGMLLSITLLIADVFLPIPASLIMIANGAIYGPWLGAFLSLLGGVGATMTGYFLGRAGEQKVSRWMGAEERAQAKAFFDKWGLLAVVVSRPIPLLSETVAIMAGLSKWSIGLTLLSGILGFLPVVIIYALSGAFASQQDYGLFTFFIVMALGGITWLLGKYFYKPLDVKETSQ